MASAVVVGVVAVLSVVVCAVVGIAVDCSTITTTSCCPAYCACCQPIVGCALGDADAVVVAVFVFVFDVGDILLLQRVRQLR